MKLTVLKYLSGLLLFVACSAQPPKGTTTPSLPNKAENAIQWHGGERLMPVLEMAQRLNKPVFVSFHADWCAPCKVMEEELFTQTQVYQKLNADFLNFKVDYDLPSGKTIAGLYEVQVLPTVLFLDPQGVVLTRYKGGLGTSSQFLQLAQEALSKMHH